MAFLDIMIGPLALADWLSWFCLITGAFFLITGTLGIVRLPDVFSRMHGAGMVDTLGIMLMLVGLMFQAEEWIVVAKLGLILMFIFFTAPTTTFALARAAINGGIDPGPDKTGLPTGAKNQKLKNSETERKDKEKEATSSNT